MKLFYIYLSREYFKYMEYHAKILNIQKANILIVWYSQ